MAVAKIYMIFVHNRENDRKIDKSNQFSRLVSNRNQAVFCFISLKE